MDHLFQYLGRKLAGNNSLEESEKLSRLWLSTDIYDALKKHKGTEVIEGIVPRNAYCWDRDDALSGESFTLEAFKKMRELRFLYLRKVHLTGSFEQTFQDLRWLCWDWCPLKCLPSEFYPLKLVILELHHSNIRTMWELNMVPHVFEKLKTLDISGSEDLTTTPDFTKLPCLETVHLKGCKSLEEVHISIGNLVRLVSLDLHGCVKLRSLPDTICNLRALGVFIVIHIDALKLIDPVLQDIFLDIACFFIGWQKKRVVQILETYYTNVDHNIDILKTRCLLKINKWDKLEMDHLFQYLGRKLAGEESEKLS
ncbi:hypothetical protein AgCh_037679 [Apium graveolens]